MFDSFPDLFTHRARSQQAAFGIELDQFSHRLAEVYQPIRVTEQFEIPFVPADQAQILAKVYMEGKSHAETAGELDLPLGTVKSRVRLALQKLQIQMENYSYG